MQGLIKWAVVPKLDYRLLIFEIRKDILKRSYVFEFGELKNFESFWQYAHSLCEVFFRYKSLNFVRDAL